MKYNYHTHTKRCNHAKGTDEQYIQSAITALINEVSTYKVEVDIVTSSIMNEQITRNDEYLADKSSHITKQTIPLTEEKSKPFRL